METSPICSMCNRILNPNAIQRSVLLLGISVPIDEYIICIDCFANIYEKLVDHKENTGFKRLHKKVENHHD